MNDVDLIMQGYELKIEAEHEMIWLLGNYVQYSVASCLTDKVKYPNSPRQEKKRKEMYTEDGFIKAEFAKEILENMVSRFNKGGD